MTDKVLTALDGGVLTITLNRPSQRNAIDFEMLDDLCDALSAAGADDEVRVLVLTGAGEKFCAGADISQMVTRTSEEWEKIVDHYLDPIRAISAIPKPFITRCNGDVVGGGLGLAMACEFRIASESTRFCAPFVKIGLAGCDMSAGYFLPRLVGLGKATDMMMTGRFVHAEEAERIGLASRVVADVDLDAAVAELAAQLAAGPPRGLAFTKRAIRRSLERGMEEEFDYEIFAQVQCLQSEDHVEGVGAFLERRPAKFMGR
jgi:2-(1,2-epoxy-1,2-dihydrophenyl)acetyl-CoA isomerase